MNKKAKFVLWFFLVVGLISIFSLMYFVFAAHTVTTSTGGTSYNINEDVQVTYNISVNVTGTGPANVTQVNITFVNSFASFTNNTQGTDALGDFTNTSSVLSWTNSTFYLINATSAGEIKYFWFNATASTPGDYNLTVTVLNATGPYYYNISVHVNDTTAPNMTQFVDPTPASGSNLSLSYIIYNVTATDNGIIRNITVRLYNSSRALINSSNSSTSPLYGNFSGLNEGTYYINASTFDTYNLENSTGSGTRTITLDTTAPVISLISPTNANSTQNAPSVTFTFNVTDDSTVSNCSLILNGAIVNINNSGVNRTGGTTTFVNLSYVVSNTWSINCTDNANNKVNSSSWSFSVLSFQFNGTTRDENGNALNNSVINVTIRNQANWGVLAYTPTISNASGWFNFNISSNSSWVYETIILHRNATNNNVDFRSKAIPPFSSQEMPMLAGTTFYLTEAGTINITAVNETGGRTTFQYQIKDTKLGYPIAEDHTSYVNEVVAYVPKNRNYSIMIYPNQDMPVSYNWNNFSSTTSYSFSYGSNYNATTKTLHKQFNVTTALPRVSGYIDYSGISGWDEFTVVPYLLEPGNMIHSEYGDMPYNMSGFGGPSGPSTDKYTLSTGFFNISIPATVESSTLILFATARNGSNYIGGFRNISLSYSTYVNGGELTNFNFTQMSGLLGNPANISMDKSTGGQINITTAKQTFVLVNATNSTLSSVSAHIETTVDYSSLEAIEFTWMSDIAQTQTTANFVLPLLNVSGIKEMNVYASGGPSGGNAQYAPRRVPTMTAAQITANNNITIRTFNPGAIDESIGASSINIALFTSNATCDIPNPSSPCYLGGPNSDTNMSSFNPMQAVMGGGKLSFRMGYSGILVHYVNVDMLASGPPDALFDSSANTSGTSGSSFASALRFGSLGPTIYDYVLVSIPYSETAGSGLNDSASVNISVPLLYDDNWNVIWNTTANGSSASALAGNYSHYSTYQNAWGNLTTSKTCTNTSITSVSQINETNPCYIDTTNNRIWIRLPHFSGTGPSVSGSVVSAASTTPPSGGGGGGSGSTGQNKTRTNSWLKITPGTATIWKLFDRDLGIKQINITVNNPAQTVKITITKYDGKPAEVTIEKSGKVYKYLQINATNLEGKLSKAVLTIQVEKSWLKNKNLTKDKIALFKFDGVWKELKTDYKEEDSTNYYYDTELTSFSYFAIAERVEVTTPSVPTTPTAPPTPTTAPPPKEEKIPILEKPITWAIVIGIIIAVIVVILIYLYKKKYK